ncbi:cupin domain-containing protein [Ramlibacter sp. XY19]|uniref:cupin domain-containing protein n=1 Tax=Ramlibacter paludis TaxID=2908000 RepID=UPI0023DB023D|nr:cupin domain-containing protein [Ramlibacter paludis]MCG2595408.1 cupin domain-containing protein [Ramlibacter paludis]
MIIRKNQAQAERTERETFGVTDTVRLAQAGGISQYGANVQTLQPGARSSNRHWHENEDEFLYVLSGEVTVTEGTEAQVLHAGDAACWPAGVPTAHFVSNQSNQPCSYLIVGTRVSQDVCHYPDTGRTLYREGNAWRLLEANGELFKSGVF